MKIEIQHGDILTLDDENRIIQDGIVCIDGTKIIYAGTERPKNFIPDKIIHAEGTLVMPGFVNTHCHSPMTMFRNFAGGLPLQKWMFENIRPLQQYVTEEEIRSCAKLAYIEMIKSGTTAFAEMYAWADILGEIALDIGLKALIAGSYGKDQGLAGTTEKSVILEHSKKISERSKGRVEEGLLLHALYSVPEDVIRNTVELAKEYGFRIQIHVSETKKEIEDCYEKYGVSPVEKLAKLGVFDVPAIAAHCVYLTDNDYSILKERHACVSHCPVSNLKLGSGMADISKLDKKGITVCLGTDGVASNNNLNIFKEMNIAALLAKGIHCDPIVIPAEKILRMAVKNGYKALGIENSGCIKAGMNADLIIVSTKEPHFTPITDYYDALVYSGQASDVVLTMVDGNILMENRELANCDEEKILAEAKMASQRILSYRS